VLPHHLIKSYGKMVARLPPSPDLAQGQGCSSQDDRVNILMRDGIAPIIQLPQTFCPVLVPSIVPEHSGPKREAENG
jgi:hypothetical protein